MPIVTEHILCRKCGYRLKALPEPRCPECGTAFNLSDPATFKSRRRFHWRGAVIVLVIVIPAAFLLIAGLVLALMR